ncbi:transcription factor HES-1 [Nephila pilipes]|uniref:Transcription factor HES-1 n=1 Tax=Nephila pilipes TaxID=299642 RepID=A0A8X6T8P3_NEPPI|nr:transcription factor HES-1 [Nephila pilipes]
MITGQNRRVTNSANRCLIADSSSTRYYFTRRANAHARESHVIVSGMTPSLKPSGLHIGCVDNRKASKPLIEKRRRARINRSLSALKELVVPSEQNPQSPNSRPPKLEKADVLEKTVEYVKRIKELNNVPLDDRLGEFDAGYTRCLNAVQKFLETENYEMKSRLLSHLNNSYASLSGMINPYMDDTSSSCSSGSRSQTPASVAAESCQLEHFVNCFCTDSEQDVSSNELSVITRTFQPQNVTHTGSVQRDPVHQCKEPSFSGITVPTTAPLNLATNSNDQCPKHANENVCNSISHDVWRPWHDNGVIKYNHKL